MMGLKVYKKNEYKVEDAKLGDLMRVTDADTIQRDVAATDDYYETPKLLRRDGIYYIAYETAIIEIEEWEAMEVYENPELVYDIIISHKRKFYFNTAEDTIR